MKRIALCGALTATLCLAVPAMAQTSLPTPAASPPSVDPAQDAQKTSAPTAPPATFNTFSIIRDAQPPLALAVADALDPQPLQDPTAVPGAPNARDEATPTLQQRMNTLGVGQSWSAGYSFDGTAGRSDRALVIRFSDTDAKTLSASEEDLNIMARILDKAIFPGADAPPQAMGVTLINLANSSGVKSFQIEGFGPVFLLNVDFPLMGPPAKTDETENKEPSNSTWDEAKRELYGQPGGGNGGFGQRVRPEPFDAARVEKLKDALLDALKNASNMRNVKSDEYVTLVVTGHAAGMVRFRGGSGGGGGGGGGGFGGGGGAGLQGGEIRIPGSPSPRSPVGGTGGGGMFGFTARGGGGGGGGGFGGGLPGSTQASPGAAPGGVGGRVFLSGVAGRAARAVTMTIRAKKSDIDTFAKGKMNLDEFRKKAVITIY